MMIYMRYKLRQLLLSPRFTTRNCEHVFNPQIFEFMNLWTSVRPLVRYGRTLTSRTCRTCTAVLYGQFSRTFAVLRTLLPGTFWRLQSKIVSNWPWLTWGHWLIVVCGQTIDRYGHWKRESMKSGGGRGFYCHFPHETLIVPCLFVLSMWSTGTAKVRHFEVRKIAVLYGVRPYLKIWSTPNTIVNKWGFFYQVKIECKCVIPTYYFLFCAMPVVLWKEWWLIAIPKVCKENNCQFSSLIEPAYISITTYIHTTTTHMLFEKKSTRE